MRGKSFCWWWGGAAVAQAILLLLVVLAQTSTTAGAGIFDRHIPWKKRSTPRDLRLRPKWRPKWTKQRKRAFTPIRRLRPKILKGKHYDFGFSTVRGPQWLTAEWEYWGENDTHERYRRVMFHPPCQYGRDGHDFQPFLATPSFGRGFDLDFDMDFAVVFRYKCRLWGSLSDEKAPTLGSIPVYIFKNKQTKKI